MNEWAGNERGAVVNRCEASDGVGDIEGRNTDSELWRGESSSVGCRPCLFKEAARSMFISSLLPVCQQRCTHYPARFPAH